MELWEISSDFDAIDIDRDTMAICNPQMREAYTLYNAALEKIRFGKSNEARIDLRKATQLYPGFDDAYILLGLCIFASGNRIDAMRTFNQINDGEKHNAAMRYFDMLSESSRDVVTGYKQNQNYREPVRAVGAVFKEIDNNSPEERQRRKAAEDAFAFFAETAKYPMQEATVNLLRIFLIMWTKKCMLLRAIALRTAASRMLPGQASEVTKALYRNVL